MRRVLSECSASVRKSPQGLDYFATSSEVIQVPNVIRIMIRERVVRQYTQYCLETNF